MIEDTNENLQDENVKNLFDDLDAIIASTDLSKVTAESTGFDELPEAYYLCEVESAKLTTSKNSGQPMISFQYKVLEDGKNVDEKGNLVVMPGTKNRKIFKHYVLKDGDDFKKFVTDALKFEDSDGNAILEKEMLLSSQLINDCLDVLEGRNIYLFAKHNVKKDGTQSIWYNLVTWETYAKLDMEE